MAMRFSLIQTQLVSPGSDDAKDKSSKSSDEYEYERSTNAKDFWLHPQKKRDNFVSRSLAAAVTPFYLIVPIKLDPLMPRFLDEDDALQRRDEFVGGAEPVVRGLALASLRQRHHYERRVRRVLR